MPFPDTTTLIDDFNDGTAPVKPGVWATKVGSAAVPDITVVANQLAAASASDNGCTIASFGPNIDFYLTCIVPPNAASYIALFSGLTTPTGAFGANSLVLVAGSPNDTWNVRRYTAGSSGGNIITPTSTHLVNGDKIGIEASGTTIRVWKNPVATGVWGQVGTDVTGQTVNAGVFGVELGDTTQRWEDASGGTVGAGAPTFPFLAYQVLGGNSQAVQRAATI